MPFGDAQALAEAITPYTCAFLTEPIQGEAGVRIPPDGYLAASGETVNGMLVAAIERSLGLRGDTP